MGQVTHGKAGPGPVLATSHLANCEEEASVAPCRGVRLPCILAPSPQQHRVGRQLDNYPDSQIFCEALLLLSQPPPPLRSRCGVGGVLASHLWIPTSAWRLPNCQTSKLATVEEIFIWRIQFGVSVIILPGFLSLLGLTIYTTLSSSATASGH